MFIIYLLLFVSSLAWIRTYYKSLFVPMTIVSVTWCLFPAIADLGVLGLYPIALTTHFYIMLSYISFFAINAVSYGSKYKKNEGYYLSEEVRSVKSNVNYKVVFWGNVIVAAWLFTKLGQSLNIIQSYGFVYLRNIYENNFSSSTVVNIIYNWFAKPFVVATCAIFCIDVMQRRNRQQLLIGIIIIINVLLDTVIFAARATIVKLVIFLFFSVFFCRKRDYTRRQKFFVVIIVIALMMVVVFMTGERMSESYASFSFLDSVAMYYIAPFGLLNYYIKNPSFSLLSLNHLTYGTGMFGAFYNIFRSVAYVLLGSEYNGSDYIIQLVTQQTVRVGEKVSMNSACTADYIFLRDAGIIGIIIGFALMSFIIEKSRQSYFSRPSVQNGAIYISLLYVVFRLSMSYDFLTPSTLFSLLYIYICTKESRIKISLGRKIRISK